MPGGTRTPDLQLRKLSLYPTELQARNADEYSRSKKLRATAGLTSRAEREGFEPSKGALLPYSLSRRAPSTTRPPPQRPHQSSRDRNLRRKPSSCAKRCCSSATMPAGEVPERTNGAVLKTVEVQASVGSNPTLSAIPEPCNPVHLNTVSLMPSRSQWWLFSDHLLAAEVRSEHGWDDDRAVFPLVVLQKRDHRSWQRQSRAVERV
jgi:hypothetical protein